MPLSNLEKTGLTAWCAIQTGQAGTLEACYSPVFTGDLVGVMNGQKNKISIGKKEMVGMAMATAEAINVLKTFKLEFGLGLWGKNEKPVFLIKYDQTLEFTPTAPPAENAAEKDQALMLSRGIQAYEWELNDDGKAVFTTLHGIEIDNVQPLNWQDVADMVGNAKTEDPQGQTLQAKTLRKLRHIVTSDDFPKPNEAGLHSLDSRDVVDLQQLIRGITPVSDQPAAQPTNQQQLRWWETLFSHA